MVGFTFWAMLRYMRFESYSKKVDKIGIKIVTNVAVGCAALLGVSMWAFTTIGQYTQEAAGSSTKICRKQVSKVLFQVPKSPVSRFFPDCTVNMSLAFRHFLKALNADPKFQKQNKKSIKFPKHNKKRQQNK